MPLENSILLEKQEKFIAEKYKLKKINTNIEDEIEDEENQISQNAKNLEKFLKKIKKK